MRRKTLGVLGGMGPAAGFEFCAILTRKWKADRDQDHPTIVMFSDPTIPDRTAAICGAGEDPTPALRAGIERCVRNGADFIAVPCNTASYFIDRFVDDLPVPLMHIIEAGVSAAASMNAGGAWILSTDGTRNSHLYERRAEQRGYRLRHVDDENQRFVQRTIELVKAGKLTESGELLQGVARRCVELERLPILLACTELPLAYEHANLSDVDSVSSLEALADACIEVLR